MAFFGEPLDERRAVGDLGPRLGERLALLERHQHGEVFLVGHDQLEPARGGSPRVPSPCGARQPGSAAAAASMALARFGASELRHRADRSRRSPDRPRRSSRRRRPRSTGRRCSRPRGRAPDPRSLSLIDDGSGRRHAVIVLRLPNTFLRTGEWARLAANLTLAVHGCSVQVQGAVRRAGFSVQGSLMANKVVLAALSVMVLAGPRRSGAGAGAQDRRGQPGDEDGRDDAARLHAGRAQRVAAAHVEQRAAPAPPGFAVVCEDFDAGNPPPWVHWVIYKIPPTATGLPANAPDRSDGADAAGVHRRGAGLQRLAPPDVPRSGAAGREAAPLSLRRLRARRRARPASRG